MMLDSAYAALICMARKGGVGFLGAKGGTACCSSYPARTGGVQNAYLLDLIHFEEGERCEKWR